MRGPLTPWREPEVFLELDPRAMQLEVRDYRPADREHLGECLSALLDEMVGLDPWHRTRRTPDYTTKSISKCLREVRQNDGFILVGEADHEPAGIAVAWISGMSEVERTITLPTRVGLLYALSVLPGFRKNGVGSALLAECERRFRQRGCDQLGLFVFAGNKGAQRLYARHGFRDRAKLTVKQLGPPLRRWPPPPGTKRKPRRVHP